MSSIEQDRKYIRMNIVHCMYSILKSQSINLVCAYYKKLHWAPYIRPELLLSPAPISKPDVLRHNWGYSRFCS